jgi:acyl-coenzyme A thioesterase PaaI-like protein
MPLADRIPLARLFGKARRDGDRNLLCEVWNLLSGMPGGKIVFSRLVGRFTPYAGNVHATVAVLRPGYAEVRMQDRRAVRNHLDCVHEIALANLADLAGTLALACALPDDARAIPSGMQVEYMKPARGPIVAAADCGIPRTSSRARHDVTVRLRDESLEEVARIVLHRLIGPKPGVMSDRGDVN